MLSSPLMQPEIRIYSLVRKCVKLSPFSEKYLYKICFSSKSTDCRYYYGTNCAPVAVDLVLFGYERYFMLSLSDENQSEVIEAFSSTTRYLDDLLNIGNNFFDSMVDHIYPSELQSNKVNVLGTEASFLDLHLSISDGSVKINIYDKRNYFDFDIVNFPFLDGDVPRSISYVFIFLNLFFLLECLVMLMTLILVIKF